MEGKEQGEAPCCHLFSLLAFLGALHLEGSPLWSLEEIHISSLEEIQSSLHGEDGGRYLWNICRQGPETLLKGHLVAQTQGLAC